MLTGLNFITETDLGVRVELVANNDLVVYTDANTDPFDDSLSGANSALQQNLDSVIGSENYDVGHLFSGVGGAEMPVPSAQFVIVQQKVAHGQPQVSREGLVM